MIDCSFEFCIASSKEVEVEIKDGITYTSFAKCIDKPLEIVEFHRFKIVALATIKFNRFVSKNCKEYFDSINKGLYVHAAMVDDNGKVYAEYIINPINK